MAFEAAVVRCAATEGTAEAEAEAEEGATSAAAAEVGAVEEDPPRPPSRPAPLQRDEGREGVVWKIE